MGLAETMKKLSIIIVNYNTCGALLDCLQSLRQHGPKADLETIVIDNASTDSSVARVEAQFPEVIVIANAENRGFSAANNQGLQRATGDHLLLLNSDTLVKAGALDALALCLEEHTRVGIASCQLLNADGSPQLTHNVVPNLPMLFAQATGARRLFSRQSLARLASLLPGFLLPKTLRVYLQPYKNPRLGGTESYDLPGQSYLSGACLMIRRACLEDIGLLDENFFLYCEDADLCLRAQAAGWKLRFLPGPRIVHLVGRSAGPSYREISWEAHKSTLYFFRKHRGFLAFLLAKGLVSLMVMRMILTGLWRRNPPVSLKRGANLLWSVLGAWSFPPRREPRLESGQLAAVDRSGTCSIAEFT